MYVYSYFNYLSSWITLLDWIISLDWITFLFGESNMLSFRINFILKTFDSNVFQQFEINPIFYSY